MSVDEILLLVIGAVIFIAAVYVVVRRWNS